MGASAQMWKEDPRRLAQRALAALIAQAVVAGVKPDPGAALPARPRLRVVELGGGPSFRST